MHQEVSPLLQKGILAGLYRLYTNCSRFILVNVAFRAHKLFAMDEPSERVAADSQKDSLGTSSNSLDVRSGMSMSLGKRTAYRDHFFLGSSRKLWQTKHLLANG